MVEDRTWNAIKLLKSLAAVLITFYVGNTYAQDSCPVARGAATLAALRPGYPIQDTIDMLSAASPHPAIAIVHKSFGNQYSQLRTIIDGLLNHKSHPSNCVSVIVYVECGPCRVPRRPSGQFPLILPRVSIPALNKKLEVADLPTLKAFNKDLQFIEGQLPKLPGVRYILEAGLEDNFTETAYKALSSLIEQTFQGRADWTLARNRIDNRSVARPVIKEVHSYDIKILSTLIKGDIVTGDGKTLCLPTEKNCKGIGKTAILSFLKEAKRRGIIVLLWRPEWQGLTSQPLSSFLPPSKRHYKIIGRDYIRQLLKR